MMSFSTGVWRQGRGFVSVDLKFNDEKIATIFWRCTVKERPMATLALQKLANDPKTQTEKLEAFIKDCERKLADAKESVAFYETLLTKVRA